MSVKLTLVNTDEHVDQTWSCGTYVNDAVNYGQCEAEAASFLEDFLTGDLLRGEARAAADALAWLHDGTWTLEDRVNDNGGWCFGEWVVRVDVSADDATTVHVFADGFGAWHADVVERGTGDAVNAERLAREAITKEITDRNPAEILTGLKLEQRVSRDGTLTSYFIEVDRDPDAS